MTTLTKYMVRLAVFCIVMAIICTGVIAVVAVEGL